MNYASINKKLIEKNSKNISDTQEKTILKIRVLSKLINLYLNTVQLI